MLRAATVEGVQLEVVAVARTPFERQPVDRPLPRGGFDQRVEPGKLDRPELVEREAGVDAQGGVLRRLGDCLGKQVYSIAPARRATTAKPGCRAEQRPTSLVCTVRSRRAAASRSVLTRQKSRKAGKASSTTSRPPLTLG